jgi:hypothetical protein
LSLEQLDLHHPEQAAVVEKLLLELEARRSVLQRWVAAVEVQAVPPWTIDAPVAVEELVEGLRARAAALLTSKSRDEKADLSAELAELSARDALGHALTSVEAEIDRKKKIAAFELCLGDTRTNAITAKSTQVTKATVTDTLVAAFAEELKRLRFRHVEVELKPAGGGRGSLYHQLVLRRAPGQHVADVVSEGEARCLSIASFFAELATAANPGAILFDDPVSSLDHHWRELVAQRLVEEAKTRQVIVYTHDIVFLLALDAAAQKQKVNCAHQHLRREHAGAGVASPDLPWVAMGVSKRIGWLKSAWQGADKLHRTASREAYEKEAVFIYGRLREAWERGFEEVLLGDAVQRYRPSVETNRASMLHDITEQDCEELREGMSKSSRWLPGHDAAAAESAEVPEPDELKRDIAELEAWVKRIRGRRA